jgi:2-polyprenyl-6-methoxyphenol hydroxylase-like FAD-dependent oxidoreductase
MTASVADNPLGDSFSIGPSAISAFKNWPQLEAMNSEIAYDPLVSFHNVDGKRVSGPKDFSKMLYSASADKIYRHSRPKFHSMLLQQLRDIGVEVEYGCEVHEYFDEAEHDRAGIVLRDGSRVVGDLVVAADGIRSRSWPLIAGREVPVRSSGDAVFRVAYPVHLALADPLIAERFPLLENGRSNIELWQGAGVQAAFWRNEHEMSWSLSRPVSHPICLLITFLCLCNG